MTIPSNLYQSILHLASPRLRALISIYKLATDDADQRRVASLWEFCCGRCRVFTVRASEALSLPKARLRGMHCLALQEGVKAFCVLKDLDAPQEGAMPITELGKAKSLCNQDFMHN